MLLDAFDSSWIAPLGPHVDAFEREFAASVGAPHAVALSSGTAALHLALLMLGVGRGDEVITATLTFAATANAICYVGATPVFVDALAASWTLDPDLLDEELARRRPGQPAGCRGRRHRRPLRAVLPTTSASPALRPLRRARHRGRRRGARRHLRAAARRHASANAASSRSTATRSSRRAAAACWCRTASRSSSGRATSPPRRASPRRTTSTRRSASTTG